MCKLMNVQDSGDWVVNRLTVAIKTAGKGAIRGLLKQRLDYNNSQYIALSAPFRRMTLTAVPSQSAMTIARFFKPTPLPSSPFKTLQNVLVSGLRWMLLALTLTAWQAQADDSDSILQFQRNGQLTIRR